VIQSDRMEWALRLICVDACENYASGIGSCSRNGRKPDAEYTSARWCNSCTAWFGLYGHFPAQIDGSKTAIVGSDSRSGPFAERERLINESR